MAEFLFGHVGDSYDWHITTIRGHHISIPLPVIVFGKINGPAVFMSNKLAHGESYKGFVALVKRMNKYRREARTAFADPAKAKKAKSLADVFEAIGEVLGEE